MRGAICCVFIVSIACSSDAPGKTYYERVIGPILVGSCTGNTAGCHQDNGNGEALGNLDLSSFEAVQARRDVLVRHGSYGEPLLLIKAVSSNGMYVTYDGDPYRMESLHAGGAIFDVGSDSFLTLRQWLANGATETGFPAPPVAGDFSGPCSEMVPDDIDTSQVSDSDPGFAEFADIQSSLVDSCGTQACHGTRGADFYLSCGSNAEQRRLNYFMARAFVAESAEDSELIVRPLAPNAGGNYHTGGSMWASRDDSDYQAVRDWAAIAGPLQLGDLGPARTFFDEQVMPVLLKRGCAFQACHSPIVPHKLRLRAGSNGFFSVIAREKNYKEVHKGFIALESPSPLASRLVAKNLIAAHGGIKHRAGAILETAGESADPQDCPAVFEPDTATPLCVLTEWLRLERSELPSQYISDMSPGATVPLVYIERPADAVRYIDYEAYRPGADLLRADATFGASAAVDTAGGSVSLLDGCPGVGATRDAVDVRGPAVSYDGTRVAFSMKATPGGGLDVYEVGIDGSNCRQVTTDGGAVANNIVINNLDPTYVIDADGVEWVVYASSRGGASGPIRSPKYLVGGLDLWRQPIAGGQAQQMTFLRGLESQPAIMRNGQLTMTKEKASEDFYQVAGRRINWDLSDYHPLLANRLDNYEGRGGYLPGEVPSDAVLRPSIDFGQATEIRSALDGNFLVILADRDSYGLGGALGTFNRSIGPFEAGRSDPAFVASLELLPGPSGRVGDSSGAYRSPFPLPDGTILASYAAGADVGQTAAVDYDIVMVDRLTGARTPLVSAAGSQVEAVLAYSRPPPKVLELPQTGEGDVTATVAQVHFPDLPLLATILDSNNRRGRAPESMRSAVEVRFFEQLAPPPECDSPSHAACVGSMAGSEAVYESRVELGTAPIAPDGSVFALVPASRAVFFELVDDAGQVLFRLREEFQFGPNEVIGIGVPQGSFNTMCAGCHGSVSGRELEVIVEPDAVTTASATTARDGDPVIMR